MCARMVAGDMAAETGVVNSVPTPAAVAPMMTILPVYFDAGMRPELTS